MSFLHHVETQLARTVSVLGLPPRAEWVLRILVRIDVDAVAAEECRQGDIHHRAGVLSWQRLVDLDEAEDADLAGLERAVVALSEWELLQVVGRLPTDPVVPGASALRLTHYGRSCLGLAPVVRAVGHEIGEETWPWTILHGTSREALLLEAGSFVGDPSYHLYFVPMQPQDTGPICGQLAEALCARGAAVLDGFALRDNPQGLVALREVISRTRTAQAPRVLLVRDPAPLRDLAFMADARMKWVEPRVHSRRGDVVMDERVTKRLEEVSGTTAADICGVPDSEIANPHRTTTTMGDLLLPRDVRLQLDRALVHARFRLEELPGQVHVPGKGQGYRLLLSGLPGTGKSLAAEALSNTLERPLMKLDLSAVLSKWLGETEKLLAQVFDVAEIAGAVLVLDEAEALFRQRDTGQSGAGALATGVAYLLTRLDRYSGVLVATTNRIRDMDEAFFRRFDDFVVLPIPDDDTREQLWMRMLPQNGEADGVDMGFLGKRFAISGGLIRGAAIRATAWAKGLEMPLSTPIVLASLARELGKADRSTAEVMVEPYRREVQRLLGGDHVPNPRTDR